jgi:hypothetical protein
VVDLTVLAQEPYPAAALIVGGLLSVFIAIYGRRDDSYLDEVGTFFAFILGGVMLVMAYFVGTEEAAGWFTLVVMVVLALGLFLKPLKEIPWSALLGAIAGGAAALAASFILPAEVFGVQEWIVLVVIFVIVGGIVHVLFHFIEDLFTLATLVVSWKPTMIIVGLVAIVEGALILMDSSLASLF